MKQCPYCLKEISEFAIQCPHCGKSLNDGDIDYSVVLAESQQVKEDKQKYKEEQVSRILKKLGIFMIILLVAIVILAGVFMIYSEIQMPRAKKFVDEGEYQKAYNILKSIKKSDAAQELLTEIRNESYILSAREATIEFLRNGKDINGNGYEIDTIGNGYLLVETTFYDYRLESFDVSKGDEDFKYPVIVLKNGAGVRSPLVYSFCVFAPSQNKYVCWGLCPHNDYEIYDPGESAENAEEACLRVTGYEPQNKSLAYKIDGKRLKNMYYSDKKIEVLK